MSPATQKPEHQMFILPSASLERHVQVELFLPPGFRKGSSYPLLIVNDGQDMVRLGMRKILENLYAQQMIQPVIIAAVHAGDRLNEYGTAAELDYLKRGNKAGKYVEFVIQNLLADLHSRLDVDFSVKAIAGFSLGGLSALDIAWNYPHLFKGCGVFSGSLWWRKKRFNPMYPDSYRIIHDIIEGGQYRSGMRFWFQCGTEDETEDRNNNGIIDSIDDTLDLIKILKSKGYTYPGDIYYHEILGGRHDVYTWSLSMPAFLKWMFPSR